MELEALHDYRTVFGCVSSKTLGKEKQSQTNQEKRGLYGSILEGRVSSGFMHNWIQKLTACFQGPGPVFLLALGSELPSLAFLSGRMTTSSLGPKYPQFTNLSVKRHLSPQYLSRSSG